VQRIVLVPIGAAGSSVPVPRRGLVLTAPDPAAQAWAARTGLPTETRPELGRPRADQDGDDTAARTRLLEALVRDRAVSDRWRDLVVVADADTVRSVTAALCDLPGSSALAGADDVVTVGLPRGPQPVSPVSVAIGAGLVALVTLVLLGTVYPLVPPGLVAALGLVLLPWSGSRHLGRTLLAVAGIAAVVVLAVVAGSTRFPVE
jgi:hypothetical protein